MTNFLDLRVVILPPVHRVCWLLVLEPLQDSLVLNGDLHELSLSLLTIQTLLLIHTGVVQLWLVSLHDV